MFQPLSDLLHLNPLALVALQGSRLHSSVCCLRHRHPSPAENKKINNILSFAVFVSRLRVDYLSLVGLMVGKIKGSYRVLQVSQSVENL